MGIKKYSNNEEKSIVEEYVNGASVNLLMEKYGFKTKKSITDKVKKYYPEKYKEIVLQAKNNRKDYSININKINNNFNAYFIGLMLTDGYIINNNSFGITLTDEDCIQFISNITQKPYYCYTNKNENNLLEYRITFNDAQQVQNMKRFGIVPRKSKIVEPPELYTEEEQFILYIIRGIIDGDGCIYSTSKGSPAFYICTMSYLFADWVRKQLIEKLFMKDVTIHQRHNDIWIVETALQYNIYKLIALVYDKPFGMNRKYEFLRKTFRDYNSGNSIFMLD